MSLTSLLDRKVSLQRPSITRDASGGAIRAYATLLGNLPASIAPATAKINAEYAKREMVVDHHVYFAADLDALIPGGIRLGDRIVEGSAMYLVKAVKRAANALVSADVMYEVDCERIEP